MHLPSAYNYAISWCAAMGSLTYGYAVAVLGNTLTKAQFYEYMKLDPTTSHARTIIAVWNTIIYAGGLIGIFCFAWAANRYGRKGALRIAAVSSILGAALQAGSVDPAMMIVARAIVGVGIGVCLSQVPLYQAEISPPANRGIVVGLHACLLGFGSTLSNWIGVGFFYVKSSASWRVPLAIQVIFPILLLLFLFFIPESPRWLYMHDRADEAEKVLIRLHQRRDDPNHEFARKEMDIIRKQLDFEAINKVSTLQGLKKRSMQKRFLIGWLSIWNTQVSGVIVVLAYQAVIYEGLGFSPFLAGVLGGVWTLVLTFANLFGGIIGDYVGRKKQIAVGLSSLIVILTVLCATTKLYATSTNKAGKTVAAVFTFLMVAAYALGVECASLVYASELFPGQWRAAGVSTSLTATLWGGLIFTAAAPAALHNIGALYYVVFIACTTVQLLIVIFFFPDTQGYTLEQMAAIFGDPVVDMEGNIEKSVDFVKEHRKSDADMLVDHTRIEDTSTSKV